MVEKSGSHFYLKVTFHPSKSSRNIKRKQSLVGTQKERDVLERYCQKKELSTEEGKSENIFQEIKL